MLNSQIPLPTDIQQRYYHSGHGQVGERGIRAFLVVDFNYIPVSPASNSKESPYNSKESLYLSSLKTINDLRNGYFDRNLDKIYKSMYYFISSI